MQNDQYKQYLIDTWDRVAGWIDNPRAKALFVQDMNHTESLWQAYKKQVEQIIRQQKNFLKSPKGQKYRRENTQWEAQWERIHRIGEQEVRWLDEGDEIVNPPSHGTQGRPHIPKIMTLAFPESPLAKFKYPIKHETFIINDYRVLTGALHDGFLWEDGDMGLLICPRLAKAKTVVEYLYWEYKEDSRYHRSIAKALRVVEKNLKDKGLLGGEKAKKKKARKKATEATVVKEKPKPGRRALPKKEVEKRLKILKEWNDPDKEKRSRFDFCIDKGITIADLEKYQACELQRKNRRKKHNKKRSK